MFVDVYIRKKSCVHVAQIHERSGQLSFLSRQFSSINCGGESFSVCYILPVFVSFLLETNNWKLAHATSLDSLVGNMDTVFLWRFIILKKVIIYFLK